MPSPKLSVRVSDTTYATLLKLAEIEKKSMTELVRELIEQGLGKREDISTQILDEVRLRHMEMAELVARAVKAGGQAAAYALLSTRFTSESQHFLVTDGQTLDDTAKKQRQAQWEKFAKSTAERFLNEPFEKL
jgi:predicted DNA-binding protein|nr:ribbon-helix-helix protein, CopG family [Nitrosomonas nitrosa]